MSVENDLIQARISGVMAHRAKIASWGTGANQDDVGRRYTFNAPHKVGAVSIGPDSAWAAVGMRAAGVDAIVSVRRPWIGLVSGPIIIDAIGQVPGSASGSTLDIQFWDIPPRAFANARSPWVGESSVSAVYPSNPIPAITSAAPYTVITEGRRKAHIVLSCSGAAGDLVVEELGSLFMPLVQAWIPLNATMAFDLDVEDVRSLQFNNTTGGGCILTVLQLTLED